MIWIDINQIIQLHDVLVSVTGGEIGIRDYKILELSIMSPLQTFDGIDLYPTFEEKMIRLSYNLIMNHPFLDGNKRIGDHILIVLFEANNIKFEYGLKELTKLILDLAASIKDYTYFFNWIISHLH